MLSTDQKTEFKTEVQQDLINRISILAREKFAARAAEYDRTATFPAEDFDDLFREGLLAPVVPKEHGGYGLGPYTGDVFTLWMMTKEIARADLSLARCWEGHVNSLVLLDGMANEEQKTRWFKGVVERGEKWVAWSGEPQARKPDEPVRFGTTVEKVDGGYIVDGNKAFATSAGGAQWAILLVNTAGPGGVRHADASALDSVLMMACNLSDPSVEIDSIVVGSDRNARDGESSGPLSPHVYSRRRSHRLSGTVSEGRLADVLHSTLRRHIPRRGGSCLRLRARLHHLAEEDRRSIRATSHRSDVGER